METIILNFLSPVFRPLLILTISIIFGVSACSKSDEPPPPELSKALPVAKSDYSLILRNQTIDIPVVSNDFHPDGLEISLASFTQPSNGNVTQQENNDTNLRYTPKNNFTGRDSFTYTISDKFGGTATTTVEIDVNGWSQPTTIGTGSNINLAIGGDGQAAAVWIDANTIYASQFNITSGWQDATVLFAPEVNAVVNRPQVKVNKYGLTKAAWINILGQQASFYTAALNTNQWEVQLGFDINTADIDGINAGFELSENGTATVAWSETNAIGESRILLQHSTSSVWSKYPELVAQNLPNKPNPKIAIDNYGQITTVWSNDALLLNIRNPTYIRQITIPERTLNAQNTTTANHLVAGNSSGRKIVIWLENNITSGEVSLNATKFQTRSKSPPITESPFIIQSNAADVTNVSAVINAANNIAVVWQQPTPNGSAVWLYQITGPYVSKTKISSQDENLPNTPVVSIDKNNHINVLWTENQQILSRRFDGDWHNEVIIADAGADENSLNLVVDDNGNAIAIWLQNGSTIFTSVYCVNADSCAPTKPSHINLSTSPCINCHDNVTTPGKTSVHPSTSDACNKCHRATVWTEVTVFHGETNAPCVDCHNGVIASEVPSSVYPDHFHLSYTTQCELCHQLPGWSNLTYSHDPISAQQRYPGDHNARIECWDCHVGSKVNDFNHTNFYFQFQPQCAWCHFTSFVDTFHPKVQRVGVTVNYTAFDLSDCTSACHIYEDDLLTIITVSRPAGYHGLDKATWK